MNKNYLLLHYCKSTNRFFTVCEKTETGIYSQDCVFIKVTTSIKKIGFADNVDMLMDGFHSEGKSLFDAKNKDVTTHYIYNSKFNVIELVKEGYRFGEVLCIVTGNKGENMLYIEQRDSIFDMLCNTNVAVTVPYYSIDFMQGIFHVKNQSNFDSVLATKEERYWFKDDKQKEQMIEYFKAIALQQVERYGTGCKCFDLRDCSNVKLP